MDFFILLVEELKKLLFELYVKNEQGILQYKVGIDKLKIDF